MTAMTMEAQGEARRGLLAGATAGLVPFAPTILRAEAGLVFLIYGMNKLGNPEGFAGFVGSLGLPIPTLLAWLVIGLEVAGGAALIAGLLVRPVALLFAIEMIVTSILVRVPLGFAPDGATGLELDLSLLAISIALVVLGPGRLSVDRDVLRRELI